jgi:hypothetical protein
MKSDHAMKPESMDEITAQLFALEEALLDPAVRRDRARVSELVADDFVEFGSSGRVWTRDAILDLLEAEKNFIPPSVEEMACRSLGEGVMLVTYRTVRFNMDTGVRSTTLRSSVWTNGSRKWQIRFHQGTRADSTT